MSKTLSDSVSNGIFTSTLNANANEENITALETVTADEIEISPATFSNEIINPDNNDNSSLFVIIIIITLIISLIIIYCCYTKKLRNKKKLLFETWSKEVQIEKSNNDNCINYENNPFFEFNKDSTTINPLDSAVINPLDKATINPLYLTNKINKKQSAKIDKTDFVNSSVTPSNMETGQGYNEKNLRNQNDLFSL